MPLLSTASTTTPAARPDTAAAASAAVSGPERTPDGRVITDMDGSPLQIGDRVRVDYADDQSPFWNRRIQAPCVFRGIDRHAARYGIYIMFEFSDGHRGPQGQTGFQVMCTDSRDSACIMDMQGGSITHICDAREAAEREQRSYASVFRLDRARFHLEDGIHPAWAGWKLTVQRAR